MKEAFQVIVLGSTGGPRENNLSGYLFSPVDTEEWIALDAGSLLGGIDVALVQNSLRHVSFRDKKLTPAAEMLTKKVLSFLLSHAHLDHILGLVINSQIDSPKTILGIDPTIDNLRDHIFNGLIWPNYGSEGVEPMIRLYTYVRLSLHKRHKIPRSSLNVEAFLLSHPHGYPSTAFLIEHNDLFFLYIGDTSSDLLEPEKHLTRIWERIAPLIQTKKLRGIMLECSYTHAQAAQVVYGHLDPSLMLKELHRLQEIAATPLEGFKVTVTHRKELLHQGVDAIAQIQKELLELNDLGISFVFPKQGERLLF